MKDRISSVAAQLDSAWQERVPIEPLHITHPQLGVADAYKIQQAWIARRLEQGDQVVGRKVGLTSRVMQQQLGVHEPDFGTLLQTLELPIEKGVASASIEGFIQPKVEGELAFLLGGPVEGPDATVVDVFQSTTAVAAAIEVIDSRIRDWQIGLVDTVADNASFGAFALGPWNTSWREQDLSLTGMALYVNGEVAASGAGAAAWGHPAASVAWLANKLATFGHRLEAGEIILSGSLGPAVAIKGADLVRLELDGFGTVSIAFKR